MGASTPSGEPGAKQPPRPWIWAAAVSGTFTLTAATLSIELARYGFGDGSGLEGPLVFWGVLGAGVLVTTVVFAPIGVWVRVACAVGGYLGGVASGIVFWINEGGPDVGYFVLIAAAVSGWLIAIYWVWLLVVGALLRAFGFEGYPASGRKVAAAIASAALVSIVGVVIAGEVGAFA